MEIRTAERKLGKWTARGLRTGRERTMDRDRERTMGMDRDREE